MEFNKKMQMLFAVGGALFIWMILNVLRLLFPEGSTGGNFVIGLGGSMGGVIQFTCYAMFIYTLLELNRRAKLIDEEYAGFDDRFLPETENLVITPDEVGKIKLQVIKQENEDHSTFVIRELIKKVSNQYRNNHSVGEAYQILESQIKMAKEVEEAKLEPTRYTLQALSMLGLVGTLIGLTQAIGKAGGMLDLDPAVKEQSLLTIVSNFSMAFGTTLVAIVLVLILTQRYHSLISKVDIFYSKSENYIIDNLISRIYKPS